MLTTDTRPAPAAPSPARGRRSLLLSTCILKANGLKKSFGGLQVIDGVDLELHQGEVVLLRGENGSGKTTLLNILTGSIEPDAGMINYLADSTPRTYRFPRRFWRELNPFDHFTPEFVAQEGIGRTWQDVRLFSSQSLIDNIAVAAPGHPGENPILALLAPRQSARCEATIVAAAAAVLTKLGLGGRENSSADKISLGQAKRVAIARAIAAGAKILFLDEPLAGLDHRGIADVLAMLKSLVREQSVTLVIVEHVFNQSRLGKLVTTDWLLEKGKLVVSQPESVKDDLPIASTVRPSWLTLLASEGDEIVDELLPRGALLTHIRRPNGLRNPSKPVLQISDLVVKRGSRTVIGMGQASGFNLTLQEGEIAILQAPNGWGKSTLFAAATGLIPVESGDIRLAGRSLHGLAPWERVRRGLHALPSEQHSFLSLKTREALKLAGRTTLTGLGPLAERTCSSLSGGQRQRVALASLPLTEQHSIILLDEPFSMLDSAAVVAEASKLRELSGKTILVLSPSTFTDEFQKEGLA